MPEEKVGGHSEAELLAEVKQLKSALQPSQEDVKILQEGIVFLAKRRKK
ncbi:MAG TPA: hypothetical protein IAC15_09685 [Candidatus Onthomonas avicola]|nr:hypothetical protein [Candidatus Onthomonas avicola]